MTGNDSVDVVVDDEEEEEDEDVVGIDEVDDLRDLFPDLTDGKEPGDEGGEEAGDELEDLGRAGERRSVNAGGRERFSRFPTKGEDGAD